jgi:N-acetylmuramoyl-L-alanine amidase
MTIFTSAGHNPKGVKTDSGAIGINGIRECDKTVEFRDLVNEALKPYNQKVISDYDDETLGQYLRRIQTGSGSVVGEFHFDAFNGKATGASSIVGNDADRLDKAFAKEGVDLISEIFGIANRGVITESDSHRGRLGLMRETGTVALFELGFIDNPNDMERYEKFKHCLAERFAELFVKFEKMV